jgi:hypothetical protein
MAVEALEALAVEQGEDAALLRGERGLVACQVAIVGASPLISVRQKLARGRCSLS